MDISKQIIRVEIRVNLVHKFKVFKVTNLLDLHLHLSGSKSAFL